MYSIPITFIILTFLILEAQMKTKEGFTLVELMVVVVIVALLAALLIPMLTARIEAAKWSEGKSAAGTIATALRAYVVERTELEGLPASGNTEISSFMSKGDLEGKYFSYGDYVLSNVDYNPTAGAGEYTIEYTIQVNRPVALADDWEKLGYTLDHTGTWTEVVP